MQFNTGLIDVTQMQQAITPLLDQVREIQPENRLARAIEKLVQLHPDVFMDQDTFRRGVDELRSLLPMLPSETYISEFMEVIDPKAIHDVRRFVSATIATKLKPELLEQYEEHRDEGNYKIDAISIGNRSLKKLPEPH